MRRLISTLSFLAIVIALTAQTEAERQAIKQFCGCFEVSFEYTETFPRYEDYHLAAPYKANAIEYMVLDEEIPNKLVIQNILVINDTFFIKHWRQDWEYQPTNTFEFEGNKRWTTANTSPREVQGRWSQEVYEVDDSPRYSAVATWNFNDGKKVWESTADAPLPRREYTKRSDYQILRRHNRLILDEEGWVHEQDNQKIAIDSANQQHIIVEEKGWNTYHRIDPKRCQAAAEFWNERRWFWSQVRAVWNNLLVKPGSYTLEKMRGSDFLSDELEKLSTQKFKDETAAREAIQKVIDKYRQFSEASSRK
ncbi:MAG: hypothetical protein GC192_14130 [Bacteroidetes bacterium]|nr:hypothetical protein [Bacteroidota bacterium]